MPFAGHTRDSNALVMQRPESGSSFIGGSRSSVPTRTASRRLTSMDPRPKRRAATHRMAVAILVSCIVCLAAAQTAAAAFWIHAVNSHVKAGAKLTAISDGDGLQLFLVRASYIEHLANPCIGCARYMRHPPGAPFLAVGRVPPGVPPFHNHRFQVAIPRKLAPGRYELAIYCPSCARGPGGSVITDYVLITVQPR